MSAADPYFVSGAFTFRPIVDADVARLVLWLADPDVGGWWHGVTFDHDETFVRGHMLRERPVTQAIVELDGAPIGFQQWYSLDGLGEEDTLAEYGLAPDSGAYGIDQFIGESRFHGQGIGSAQVRAVSEWLLGADGPGAAFVVTEPIVENVRAVRAYEKAGFEKVRILPAHEALDGVKRDSWLMQKGG